MEAPNIDARLEVAPYPRRGKSLVAYRVGGEVLFSEEINLQSDRARLLFAKMIPGVHREADIPTLVQTLQQEAARQASGTIARQAAAMKRESAKRRQLLAAKTGARADTSRGLSGTVSDEVSNEKPHPDAANGVLDSADSADTSVATSQVGGERAFSEQGSCGPGPDDDFRPDEPEKADGNGVRDELVNLVKDDPRYEVFQDEIGDDAVSYVSFLDGERRSTWQVRSSGFRNHLQRRFKKAFDDVPSGTDLSDALNAIAAIPDEDTPTQKVFVRIAEDNGETWIDMADKAGRVVHVTATGWSIVPGRECPVRFLRRRGLLPMIEPIHGGSLDGLRKLLNGGPDDHVFVLVVAFLVSSTRSTGPYAILVVTGQQGTAKSTVCRLVRRLLDPNKAELRQPIREDRDLMIAAQNSFMIGIDNVSSLSPGISDRLCSLSTGAGFSARELYTDDGEKLICCARPIMLNGIGSVVTRGDALDRSIVLVLEPIPADKRMSERQYWRMFDEHAPSILGCLLDGHVSALSRRDSVTTKELPRMADQAVWLVASEPGLKLEPGTFARAMAANAKKAQDAAVEASPIGDAVVALMAEVSTWEGTYPDLLKKLTVLDPLDGKGTGFPKNGNSLRNELQRLNPSLAVEGIKITFGLRARTRERARMVRIERIVESPTEVSAASALSAGANNPSPDAENGDFTDVACGQRADSTSQVSASCPQPEPSSVASGAGFCAGADSADRPDPNSTVAGGGADDATARSEEEF